MKLKIGGKDFGQVPDDRLKTVVGHKPIDIDFVEQRIIIAVERLIRRYLHRPGARDKWLNALGVVSERQTKHKDSTGTYPRSPASAKAAGKPSSPKRAVHRRPRKDLGDREV